MTARWKQGVKHILLKLSGHKLRFDIFRIASYFLIPEPLTLAVLSVNPSTGVGIIVGAGSYPVLEALAVQYNTKWILHLRPGCIDETGLKGCMRVVRV